MIVHTCPSIQGQGRKLAAGQPGLQTLSEQTLALLTGLFLVAQRWKTEDPDTMKIERVCS